MHNVLLATLLSNNERDTRICNACPSTIPNEKGGKRHLSDLKDPQKVMSLQTIHAAYNELFAEKKNKGERRKVELGSSSEKIA